MSREKGIFDVIEMGLNYAPDFVNDVEIVRDFKKYQGVERVKESYGNPVELLADVVSTVSAVGSFLTTASNLGNILLANMMPSPGVGPASSGPAGTSNTKQ